jgi:hypothetical protein
LRTLSLVLLALTCAGCASLDRESAAHLIRSNPETIVQDKISIPFNVGFYGPKCFYVAPPVKETVYTFLRKKQMISIASEGRQMRLSLTDTGNQMLTKSGEAPYDHEAADGCDHSQVNLLLGKRGDIKVTGIQANESRALVEYEREISVSDMGREFAAFAAGRGLNERVQWDEEARIFKVPSLLPPAPSRYIATLAKYDDGWRVISIKDH